MENRSYLGSITKYSELGFGSNATVYLSEYFGSNVAYKEFWNPKYVYAIKDEIIQLSEYTDTKFIFPDKIIYEKPKDEIFKGYTMEILYKYKQLLELYSLDKTKKISLLLKARELVEELHKKYKIIHADLAPWNFMYNEEIDNIVLTDFDTSLKIKPSIQLNDICHNEIALEYAKTNKIDESLDIFLFNLCSYSLLNNVHFFNTINKIKESYFGNIEDKRAVNVLESYKNFDITKSLKKEYIIDYL